MKAEVKKELWWIFILLGLAVLVSICELFYQYSLLSEGAEKPTFTGFTFEFNPYERFLESILSYFVLIAFTRYLLMGITYLLKVKPFIAYFLVAINLLILIQVCIFLWPLFFPEELFIGGKKVIISGGHRVWPPGEILRIFVLVFIFFFSFIIQLIAIKSLIFTLQKRPKT